MARAADAATRRLKSLSSPARRLSSKVLQPSTPANSKAFAAATDASSRPSISFQCSVASSRNSSAGSANRPTKAPIAAGPAPVVSMISCDQRHTPQL